MAKILRRFSRFLRFFPFLEIVLCHAHARHSLKTRKKDCLPIPRKAVLSFLLIQFSCKNCVLSFLEAEADARIYPPFVRQVGSEVSRVGPVQVGVPV